MTLETIVTPALMAALVELGKDLNIIPKGWEKVAVFILSLFFSGLYFYNQDWLQIAVAIAGFTVASVGAYEVVVKPVKTFFAK